MEGRKRLLAASVVILALVGTATWGNTAATSTPHDVFQPVGNLTTPRTFPTVTRLNDGTVLVTGGWRRSGADYSGSDLLSQATAEVFDPKTNAFSAVGSMTYPRVLHTAVRLQDGRVLIVGGSNDTQGQLAPGPIIATAEIYDPATGKFSTTGDLITARLNATATLLPNGTVLVAGGWNTQTVETAELYDPVTGKFQLTLPMVAGRNHQAAVGLPDGRVVLLGGYHFNDGPQQSVEVYDYRPMPRALPYPFDFSPAGEMQEARAEFPANLLPDGRILITGGTSGPFDANGNATVLGSVEIYDPKTGLSMETDQMADARFGHGAISLADGRVLVVGGQHSFDPNDPDIHPSAAVLIDPMTGKVMASASKTNTIGGRSSVLLLDGRVLVLSDRPRKLQAEVYVP